MPPRVFVTSFARLSAPLDGSGILPDPFLGGRLSARVAIKTGSGEPRLHALARLAAEEAVSRVPGLAALRSDAKGVFISSSKGGMELFDGPTPDPGPLLWRYASQSPGQAVRQALGWTGPGRNTPLACATGAYSLGLAFEEIRSGRLQAALAGAVEASLTPLVVAAFHNIGALAPIQDASELRGPFDEGHHGFVLGEGAGVMVLEGEESLAETGSRPLAELRGWGSTCDAWHLTAPEPQGRQAARSVRLALEQAGLPLEAVSYVNAHGTGTVAGDQAEARALGSLFGGRRDLRVSSIKGATGHTLGAAGAIEAVVTIEAVAGGMMPANAGCRAPMAGMEGWILARPQAMQGQHAVSLSMGFGGHNVAWAISRVRR